jgi:hypothetical protein
LPRALAATQAGARPCLCASPEEARQPATYARPRRRTAGTAKMPPHPPAITKHPSPNME